MATTSGRPPGRFFAYCFSTPSPSSQMPATGPYWVSNSVICRSMNAVYCRTSTWESGMYSGCGLS